MNVKRVIGLFFVLVGIAGIFYANFQQGRIDQGKAGAQEKIDQSKKLFDGNPATELFGKSLAGSAEKKVATEVAKYEQMVTYLKFGSIALIVVGGAMLLFCGNRKTSR